MREILIGRESRSIRCDLEEYADRLHEVHGLKPEAIDDRRGHSTRRLNLLAHDALMRFIIDTPGEMVDAPCTPQATRGIGRFENVDRASRSLEPEPHPAIIGSEIREAEH